MKSNGSIKIYSFYYKVQSTIQLHEHYFPIWVGKNGQPENSIFLGDDTGENISDKNEYYSELTGLYWVWKNTKSEIVGSCHYRRYFTFPEEPLIYRIKRLLYYPAGLWKKRFGLIYTKNYKFWTPNILPEKEIKQLLSSFDIILPTRRILRQSIRQHYQKYHNPNDLILLKNILDESFPEYLNSFENVLDDNRLFANNMFIMEWKRFNKMMNWLFFILFKFEEKCDLQSYEGYQKRIFGFLSERLITLWVVHNNLNYKELPLIYFKKLKNN
ncbi:MAG: DUF4422 domain-containing protein [Draconibacterium sp.]|nr:DUF4422 domain-containing protein [Draconibacterium sp.]